MDSLIRWPWECTAHPTRSSQAASDRARRTSADGRGSGGGPGTGGDDAAGGSIRCAARRVGPSRRAQPPSSAAGSSREGSRQASQRAVRARERSPIQSLIARCSRARRAGESWPRRRSGPSSHHLGSSGATGMRAFSPRRIGEVATTTRSAIPPVSRWPKAAVLAGPVAPAATTLPGTGGWSSRMSRGWASWGRAASAPRTCIGMTVSPKRSRPGGPAVMALRRRGERRRAWCGKVGESWCGLQAGACPTVGPGGDRCPSAEPRPPVLIGERRARRLRTSGRSMDAGVVEAPGDRMMSRPAANLHP